MRLYLAVSPKADPVLPAVSSEPKEGSGSEQEQQDLRAGQMGPGSQRVHR